MASVVEILDVEDEEPQEGTAIAYKKSNKCVVIKTTTRQTVYLPVVGLVDPLSLKPGDLVGVNKDSFVFPFFFLFLPSSCCSN